MNEYLKEKLFFGLILVCILAVFVMLFNLPKMPPAEEETEEVATELDSDGDGLTDALEQILGTDKDNEDTDGDGYGDLAELRKGFDPLVKTPDDKLDDNEYLKIKESIKEADSVFFSENF